MLLAKSLEESMHICVLQTLALETNVASPSVSVHAPAQSPASAPWHQCPEESCPTSESTRRPGEATDRGPNGPKYKCAQWKWKWPNLP